MSSPTPPGWVQWLGQVLPPLYRREIITDLVEERDAMVALARIWRVDPGLNLHNLAMMDVSYNSRELMGSAGRARGLDLARRLRGTPGVVGVAVLDKAVMQNARGEPSPFQPPDGTPADVPQPASEPMAGPAAESDSLRSLWTPKGAFEAKALRRAATAGTPRTCPGDERRDVPTDASKANGPRPDLSSSCLGMTELAGSFHADR